MTNHPRQKMNISNHQSEQFHNPLDPDPSHHLAKMCTITETIQITVNRLRALRDLFKQKKAEVAKTVFARKRPVPMAYAKQTDFNENSDEAAFHPSRVQPSRDRGIFLNSNFPGFPQPSGRPYEGSSGQSFRQNARRHCSNGYCQTTTCINGSCETTID